MTFTRPEAGLFEAAGSGSELTWRGRPCWASVDLDAIETNCRVIGARLRPGARLMAVVKANAYGHGIVGVAEAALAGGAACFGVACVDEGAQLRSAGIDAPILVLGYVPHWEADRVLRLDLAVALTTTQLALALARAAAEMGRPARVHVKVDTGMGRYGVLPEEALDFMRACHATPGLDVEGIFTHLATADEPDPTHAERQLRRFDALCGVLDTHGLLPRVRHAVNSAGTFAFPDHHYDVARCGIAVYGVPPADMPGLPPLRPALNLKARVARLRTLPAGSCVGYGCTFVARRPTDVALIPIGYADGLSRSLSNRGWALVNGRRAPIVGRVSMDQATLDVTGLGDVRQDDEVTLIGAQGGDEITATEMATWRDTIAYEVLTGLHVRVPRVYLRCGRPVAVAENGEYWTLPPERY
ncbi:MAG TPA: alanine racemase [Chloroflexota bacterium]|nr:alanine racemase [Chloroflexota bacterium]